MTKTFWPGTRIVRSENNGFTSGFGAPVNWTRLQTSAAQRSSSSATVEKARAAGLDRSSIHGLSAKADARLANRRRTAPKART